MQINFHRLQEKHKKVIQETDAAISSFSSAINIQDLIKHNYSFIHYQGRIFDIIKNEKNRYIFLLDLITTHHPAPAVICDLGTFIPYLPVALSLAGYKVKIVDNYRLYNEHLKNQLRTLAEKYKIEVVDLDIINSDFSPLGVNDVVLLTAVVEHLGGSPKILMNKTRSIISKKGCLFFEVPNIAEFWKRIGLLLGHSPLPPYKDYFLSDYPYTGHNREMTVSETAYLLENTGFAIDLIQCYDYCVPLQHNILKILKKILPLKNKNQCILAKASPKTQLTQ